VTSPFERMDKVLLKGILDSLNRSSDREHIQVIDEEQVWIAKYRSALNAAPMKKSRLEAFAMRLNGMIQELVSAIGKASHRKTSARSDVKRLERSRPKIVEAGASDPNSQSQPDGSSTRNPGKERSSGQSGRRRAS
jgi:hypothetical protein